MKQPAVRIVTLVSAALALLQLSACTRQVERSEDGVLVVSQEQTAAWIRNFNPLTTASSARWPTLAGIYEPLYVFNSVKSEHVPWLAVAHEWRGDNRVLRVTTRDGVLWSDGTPFSAHDVGFTFNLIKEHAALDRRGVWKFLAAVDVVDDRTVDFSFQRIFIPGMSEIVAQQPVPRHIWSEVEDPVTFTNENPVATGPFTEVRLFRNQVFELGRNPRYWQEGKPAIKALRFPALSTNDRANLALVFDEVDWAGNFIPAVDRVYVGRDPEFHDYWFPRTGSTVFLYANTTRKPFDDVRVRKAVSMAIDRELLVDVAVFRYSRPSDATGFSDAYAAWLNPEIAESGEWVRHDVARANALLDEAGHTRGEDGIRRHPDGSPWEYEILVVSGWSDWVRACQAIARDLQAIGIDASVRAFDFSAWFQRVQKGEFDLTLGWSFEGPTPYIFYRNLMGSETVRPEGVTWGSNWHRYGSETADRALEAFELEPDPARQRALSDELQRVFVEEVPAIPLYPNLSWAEFNTRRFTGFPTRDNPYADPSPNKMDRGECLLVLTTVTPR